MTPTDQYIRDFLEPYNYIFCPPYITVREAVFLATTKLDKSSEFISILVKENNNMVGIFTKSDLVKLISQEVSLENTKLADAMTKQPYVLEYDATVKDCIQLMHDLHIEHLPIRNTIGHIFAIANTQTIMKSILYS